MFLRRLPFWVTFRCSLGSILESFWEPSSPLYSFLVALVANRAPKRYLFLVVVFMWIFGASTPPEKGVGGYRPYPLGLW